MTSEQQIKELVREIGLYKDLTRRLLRENTDLKIENAQLRAKAELVDSFSKQKGDKKG